jgi:acyl carrier protein
VVTRPGPSRSQVEAEIIRLLHEIAGIAPDVITAAASLENELQLQSVQFVELQVALEDEYDIEIDPIEIIERGRFDAIVDYVHQCATAG